MQVHLHFTFQGLWERNYIYVVCLAKPGKLSVSKIPVQLSEFHLASLYPEVETESWEREILEKIYLCLCNVWSVSRKYQAGYHQLSLSFISSSKCWPRLRTEMCISFKSLISTWKVIRAKYLAEPEAGEGSLGGRKNFGRKLSGKVIWLAFTCGTRSLPRADMR